MSDPSEDTDGVDECDFVESDYEPDPYVEGYEDYEED